jgi:hypothetical protein
MNPLHLQWVSVQRELISIATAHCFIDLLYRRQSDVISLSTCVAIFAAPDEARVHRLERQ